MSMAYCDGADIRMLDSRDSASSMFFDKELEVRSRDSLEEVDSQKSPATGSNAIPVLNRRTTASGLKIQKLKCYKCKQRGHLY